MVVAFPLAVNNILVGGKGFLPLLLPPALKMPLPMIYRTSLIFLPLRKNSCLLNVWGSLGEISCVVACSSWREILDGSRTKIDVSCFAFRGMFFFFIFG